MSAMRFTKTHEREEGRLLRRGFAHSCTGLALCWLPPVGLLFAVSGFLRVMVRLTKRHRKKRKACLAFAFLSLTVCIGVLLGEIWVYSRDPEILERTGQQVWTFIVGEENAGTLSPKEQGTEFEDMDEAGFGLTDTAGTENDLWLEEDFSAWDDDFDWTAWEEESWGDVEAFEDDSWVFDESELEWAEEDWGDESLWLEEDSGLSEEELAWLQSDEDALLGDSDSEQRFLSMGKGETILPPTE